MPIVYAVTYQPVIGSECVYTKVVVNNYGHVALALVGLLIPHVDVKTRNDGRGYLCCDIKLNGKRVTKKVHILVMEAFKGPTPNGFHIDHRDHDKTNNHISNLYFRPKKENSADCKKGSRKGVKHLTDEQRDAVAVLIKTGWRTKRIALATCSSETTIRRLRKEFKKALNT